MNIKLTNHAKARLHERVGISATAFLELFKADKYIDYREKHSCQHCLFYVAQSDKYHTAIIDWKNSKVVTITPVSKWVTDAMKRAVKSLIKNGEDHE